MLDHIYLLVKQHMLNLHRNRPAVFQLALSNKDIKYNKEMAIFKLYILDKCVSFILSLLAVCDNQYILPMIRLIVICLAS